MRIDPDTRDWILTPADEAAAAAGMRMDLARAAFALDWIEGHCCLYEGELAGQPIRLLPFQRSFLTRLYGWVRWSEDWTQWVRRFTHASLWAAKKNGKSPLAAAHNLYLMAADGEPGQKVYMMAKDGKQARIAQTHAVMMVKQSQALFDKAGGECKVNNTTLEILHLPSASKVEVVTGDDKRSAAGKHGYNGSVTIDEMHVVDRLMIESVGRAGISRKEPMEVSFSTAGTDPASAGFERYRYGQQVNSGERQDLQFLHVEYAAPADAVKASDLDAKVERYGRMANPAWGTLIKPGQFRADWERSKATSATVALFLMERLNLWVGSTNRWLDSLAWADAVDEFALDDLAGRECYAAIDLSRTRDMTALVLLFPWEEDGEEVVRLWSEFWLPEDRAKRMHHLFPFLDWARAGHLHLTPGGVVDYARVKKRVREIARGVRVLDLFYDPKYAEELTQQLVDGESTEDGVVVADGIGCERTLFRQTIMDFTGPAKELDRRVSAGRVRHTGNPVMDWQVGHCEVLTDANQNVRPVKPDPNSGKAVDGVVAAVMAMYGVAARVNLTPKVWAV